jgi:hypothetical protein
MMAMMAMMATTSIIYLLFSFYYTQSDAFVIHPPRQSFDSALNYDPFDYESAEAKLERMQNIRTLQKSFYRNETGISLPRHGVFESLPIWTDNYVRNKSNIKSRKQGSYSFLLLLSSTKTIMTTKI